MSHVRNFLIVGTLVTGLIIYLERKKITPLMVDLILRFIIKYNEGGYVNDARDYGGETKYGIAKRFHPDVDIKNLTVDQAIEIYKKDYYKLLPPITDLQMLYQVLDMAINAGVKNALKLYKPGMSLEAYKQARRNYYTKLKQFPIYGKGWLKRVDRYVA